MKRIFLSLAVASSVALSVPANAANSNAVCIGEGASFTQGFGVLEALAILGGFLFGTQIAATDCDPDFE